MRAVQARRYGPPDVLEYVELPEPVPGRGQVVVQVEAAAVNFPDLLLVANRYQVSWPLPFVPGGEFAGVVAEVGADVKGFHIGDRVVGSASGGAFAERAVADAVSLRPVPDGVDLSTAAGFHVAYTTGYQAVRTVAAVQAGEWVVVLGAAGGVGQAAMDTAQLLGARVIAAVSSETKIEFCRERGADATILYEQEDLKSRIKEITGGGADVVIDPVGGDHAEGALRALAPRGRFVCLGFASGGIPRIPLNLVLLKTVTISAYEMRTFATHFPQEAARDERELWEHFEAGRLKPHVGGTFPLRDAASALRALADRTALGKVVVTMPTSAPASAPAS